MSFSWEFLVTRRIKDIISLILQSITCLKWKKWCNNFQNTCRALLPSLTYSQIESVTAPPLPRCTVDSEEASQGSLSLLENENTFHIYCCRTCYWNDNKWHISVEVLRMNAHHGHSSASPSCAVNMWWDVKRSKASKQYTSSFKASL